MFDEKTELITKQNNLKENLADYISNKNLYQMVPSLKILDIEIILCSQLVIIKRWKRVGPFEGINSKIILPQKKIF